MGEEEEEEVILKVGQAEISLVTHTLTHSFTYLLSHCTTLFNLTDASATFSCRLTKTKKFSFNTQKPRKRRKENKKGKLKMENIFLTKKKQQQQ